MYPVESINYVLALGTVAVQIAALALLALWFFRKKTGFAEQAEFVGRWGLWLGFVLSAVGVILTLFYSEILGFAPCSWCWVQRIFLYPQAVIFALALWKKDTRIADYSIALSIFGLVVALYQHYLQMGGHSVIPCPANPGASDCAQRFLFEFGYVTFPLMAFSVFAFLIVLMLFVRNHRLM